MDKLRKAIEEASKRFEEALAQLEATVEVVEEAEEEKAVIELFNDEDNITVYSSKYFMLYSKLSYLVNTLGLKEVNIKYFYSNSSKLNSIAKFKKAIAIEEALVDELEEAVTIIEEVVEAVVEAVVDVDRDYIEEEVKSIVKEAYKKEAVIDVEAIKEEAIAFIEYMIEEKAEEVVEEAEVKNDLQGKEEKAEATIEEAVTIIKGLLKEVAVAEEVEEVVANIEDARIVLEEAFTKILFK